MPKKPASTTSQPRDRSRCALLLSSLQTNGASPAATISQRKKESENGGMAPALERARIMLVTWATATARKPTSANVEVWTFERIPMPAPKRASHQTKWRHALPTLPFIAGCYKLQAESLYARTESMLAT